MRRGFSRRNFLSGIAGAGAANMTTAAATRPSKAWIIVAICWQYNDEFTYPEGECAQPKIYFDKDEAEVECRRLCKQFFNAETPQEFEVHPDCGPPDKDFEDWIWGDLRGTGEFPEPYYVQEMET